MSGVLITGASGFIGRALVRSLIEDGVDVAVFSRSNEPVAGAHVIRIDPERVTEQVIEAQPTMVLHLATKFIARHQPGDVADLVHTNIEFGAHLLDAAHRCGSTFVMTSSAWQHEGGSAYRPVSLYAATKQAFADLAAFYRSEGLLVSDVTLFDTYGPGDTRPKLVPALIRAAQTGEPLEMSDGEQLIDLTYISDVVQALRSAMLDPVGCDGGVIRGPELVTVRSLVHRFMAVNELDLDVRWGVRPPRGREMREDWRFGHALPNWAPVVGLDEGLRTCWARQ